MRETVVVAGSVAQRPGRGGHAWVLLQYLLGFQRLGYEVLFLDRLSREMLPPGADWPPPRELEWLGETMATHGLENDWCLLLDDPAGRPLASRAGRRSSASAAPLC